ncbi:MAG: prephenate dehydrogenase [Chloroflexi bacterium]|nr:prephenate dehydrogenase [Chloroflexota bacterium]
MSAAKQLRECTVAIVGLGLMGGSLALALRGHCKSLLGCDLDQEVLKVAREKDVVDAADANIETILPQADLIVLATPARTILQLLPTISEFLREPAVIMDLGSTKGKILQAMRELPHYLDPVGGHPMCGKEKSGLKNASKDLFIGAPFALSALPRTSARARVLVEEVIQVIGARPLWIESDIHDEWVAATSHLPYLLSVALANATPLEAAPLIGPSFKSATRMAASNPEMMRDIFLTNQDHVFVAIRRFISKLENLERLIKVGDPQQLVNKFESSLNRQRRIFQNSEER